MNLYDLTLHPEQQCVDDLRAPQLFLVLFFAARYCRRNPERAAALRRVYGVLGHELAGNPCAVTADLFATAANLVATTSFAAARRRLSDGTHSGGGYVVITFKSTAHGTNWSASWS